MKKSLSALCIVLMLAGCGSSAEPDYYALQSVNGMQALNITESVKLYRPVLPSYLDRPNWVSQSGNRIDIDEGNRWAAPLDQMLGDTLAADLRQRMPNAVVITSRENMAVSPRYTLDVEVENFNAADRGTLMTAHLLLKDNCVSPPDRPQSATFRNSAGNGTAGLSELVGQLADNITLKLQQEASSSRPCKNQSGARKPE